MIGGFKKHFKGEIADEVYTRWGSSTSPPSSPRSPPPSPTPLRVHAGGMGVNLVKQYRQAGLDGIPFLSVFTVDEATLPAQQDAAVGFFSGMTWHQHRHAREQEVRRDFEKEFGYVPGSYAMQATTPPAHRQRGQGGGRQARQ